MPISKETKALITAVKSSLESTVRVQMSTTETAHFPQAWSALVTAIEKLEADAELGRLVRRLLEVPHSKIVKNVGGEYAVFPGWMRSQSGNWYHSAETPEAALQAALEGKS